MNESRKARAAQNAYQRTWRKAHPEKVKAANIRYWVKRFARDEAERMEAKSDATNKDD